MFDRTGRDAIGGLGVRPGSRDRSRRGRFLSVEPLEGRALLAASLAPIPSVTVEATAGYQVPLNGAYNGNTDNETFTVSTDNPTGGVSAKIATGQFLTLNVTHTSSGGTDPSFSGSMTFQLFGDLTPNSVSKIESLVTGTVPYNELTTQAQKVIYPNGAGTTGEDYYVVGGNTFHRVANEFPGPNDYIVQGGSLDGNGSGQVFATPYPNEISPQLIFNGIGQLALANSGNADSNDSQFFVTTGSPFAELDGNYTIFGQLVAGFNILQDMTKVTGTQNSLGTAPTNPIKITAATLSTTSPYGVVHIDATGATAGTQTNVTVTATDTTTGAQTFQTFPVLTVPAYTSSTTPTSTMPQLNTVPTPISTGAGTSTTFQLSAYNPTGGTLTYTVEGGLTDGAFTNVQNGTATVSSSGLVTVTPKAGYSGPINLIVGVEDQTNRAGSGATLASPANFSLQNVTVEVGSFPTAPTLNPVSSPINGSVSQTVQFPLSANNPTGAPLTYIVEGSLTNGAFSPVTNGAASVSPSGLVTVVPAAGYTGPVDLVVGVRDQTDRSGTGNINDPTNFNTENLVVNFAQPVSTGAVRFIPDGSGEATGNLVISPLPRPSKNAHNVINITQANGNVQVTINGAVDLNQPAVSDVDSIIFYGSTANDRVTVSPSLTMPVELGGGGGGHNVLTPGGGSAREQGWYGTNVEKQGESSNFLFGQAGDVTFVKGSGTSNVIFAGTPPKVRGHSRIRRIPPVPNGTYYKFSGDTLVKTGTPFPISNQAATNASNAANSSSQTDTSTATNALTSSSGTGSSGTGTTTATAVVPKVVHTTPSKKSKK